MNIVTYFVLETCIRDIDLMSCGETPDSSREREMRGCLDQWAKVDFHDEIL